MFLSRAVSAGALATQIPGLDIVGGTDVAEPLHVLSGGERKIQIFHAVDDQRIEHIVLFEAAHLPEHTSADLGGQIKGVCKGNGVGVFRFIEPLQLGQLDGAADLRAPQCNRSKPLYYII